MLSCQQWIAGWPGESYPHCFCLNQQIHRVRTAGQSYPDFYPSISTSSHPRGTSHSCTGNSSWALQPAVRYLGCPTTVLTQRKIFLTKQTQPSHACDHGECTAPALCCSLPQLCLPLERWLQARSQEQSNHNKGMKGRVQGKTRVANLKETTQIKINSAWMSVSKEHRTALHTGSTYCLNGSHRRCWTLWTRHVRDSRLTEAVLDLLCLHHLSDTRPVSLALLPPQLCPPFGPNPSQLSLPPTIASSYFGPLHLYTPRSLVLHVWLQQHQPTQPGQPVLQSSSAGAGSAARLLAGIQQDECTNKLHYRHSYAQKEMTTGCYCITLLNNEHVFLENTCHLIPLVLQTCTTGW